MDAEEFRIIFNLCAQTFMLPSTHYEFRSVSHLTALIPI